MTTNADVVVVGAGFAGLSAARELVRLGYDVVVMEGRDRVGGRSATTTIAGTPVDLGGTFVGPTQDAVVELAKELGCETVPTYSHGKNLIRWRGKVRSYRSTHSEAVDYRVGRRFSHPMAVRPGEPAGAGRRAMDIADRRNPRQQDS